MIDFSLTEEQKEIRELAKKFALAEILPVARKFDETHEFPHEIFRKALEVGLLNVNIPAEYGGTGLGLMEEVLINEELGWACSGVAELAVENLAGQLTDRLLLFVEREIHDCVSVVGASPRGRCGSCSTLRGRRKGEGA